MADQNSSKTEVVSVCMSPNGRRALADCAEICGQCLATYIRTAALGHQAVPGPR